MYIFSDIYDLYVSVVYCGMVFCEVSRFIIYSYLPINFELFLCHSILKPIVTHIPIFWLLCEFFYRQILLLCNYQFWLVLVSEDIPMLVTCLLLVFPFGYCGKSRQFLRLLLILCNSVVSCIQLISHHSQKMSLLCDFFFRW